MCELTLNVGFEVWILVEHLNLSLPVKFMPPVRSDFSEIVGVKAIVKFTVLQRVCISCLVNALVKILKSAKKNERDSFEAKYTACPNFQFGSRGKLFI